MINTTAPENGVENGAPQNSLFQLSIDVPEESGSYRDSMEEHYDEDESRPPTPLSLEIEDAPPSYDGDTLLHSRAMSLRKFNIQPREDEGKEILPPYSTALSLENVFVRKTELEGAVHRAQDRNWQSVCVSLQGTALTIHRYKPNSAKAFAGWTTKDSNLDMVEDKRKGLLIKSYNLQYAEVGVASDYYKKRFVIRIRAETDQFLISCYKIETFVNWLQSLITAIDLALPLDDRALPRELTVPRSRRNRQRSLPTRQTAQNGNAIREVRSQPTLRASSASQARPLPPVPSTTASSSSETGSLRTTSSQPTSDSPTTPMQYPKPTPRRLHTRPGPSFPSSSASNSPHPSVSPEGKWRPNHRWSAMYDMIYAKRCMAVLTSQSPRKSNMMIMMGKQWIVDWATGCITRCEPPDYNDVVEGKNILEKQETLRVGPCGDLIRA